jgi:predicted unusual protein kinase regulating ubiquinone biosynthesis (AarF/ABC1/UbiB family)
VSQERRLGGRLGRGARLARTGMRGAAGMASAKARGRITGKDTTQLVHEEMAARLAEVLGEMKGAAMKLGQLLSFVDLDLPEDVRSVYHDALAKLRDDAPPFDPVAIRKVIFEEYGAPPEAIFATWSDTPLAAASIGQVHAATLHDGRDVVVKVQYPGVADAVRADLRNAESLSPIARFISPNQEIEPLIEELRDRIGDELDYEREAQYQRAFAKRYRGHPFIHIPDVVAEMCRGRVLVSERVHGQKFDDVAANGTPEQKQRVAEIIFRYAFGSIGRFRLFNGDPHPGNYLIEDDGRVAFLDYGSVKMFSPERFARMRDVDDSVVADDRDAFIDALHSAGFLPPGVNVDEDLVFAWFKLYTRPILQPQPFTFTPDFAAEVLRSTTDPRSPYSEMLRNLNLPADYLLLNRIQWGLNSVLARLDAAGPWRAIRDEFVFDDAPSATPLGAQDAAWWATREDTDA